MNSFSQAGQDLWAFKTCGEKTNGTFLDIGCNDPIVHNNTYALEAVGWKGVCVDIVPFNYSKRRALHVVADARQLIPAVERFAKANNGKIDYLSMDADEASFDCLDRLVPFFKFRAITIEHDVYRLGPSIKGKIFDFLTAFDYKRVREDVRAPETPGMPWSNQPFEDWYEGPVHQHS